MSRWIDPEPLELTDEFIASVGNHPIVAELLAHRGHTSLEKAMSFLDPAYYRPAPALEMPGIYEALPLLTRAIKHKEPVLVWGDFDVDGQTATTLLVSGIQQLGGIVRHYIPVRSLESHGVHTDRLLSLLKEETRLLLTCDTGIAAVQGVAAAKQSGLEVIITDHHEIPTELPRADVIVSPRLLPANHPLVNLPGVGVAYKLIEALFAEFNNSTGCQTFLDLVALGIVADVAWLAGDTRYLLQQGIHELQHTSRTGLQALAEQAEVKLEGLTSEHIAFSLAPRLNALGRLGDANMIVDFFTTTDRARARIISIDLEALNARRKLLTDQVFAGALAQVEREPKLTEYPALVLAHPSWPGGVVGIVASRLVEYFHRAVILISAPPGEMARGSARSIPGVNITEAIATQAQLLEGFGGHPMAAGMSLQADHIDAFREGVSKAIARQLTKIPDENELRIDSWINFSELSLDMVADIYRLAPFGPGNPAPILAARRQRIHSQRQIGRYKEHLLLKIKDESQFEQEVIWWQGSGLPLPEGKFDLAYTVQPSTYQGQPGIQIAWVEANPLPEDQPVQVKSPTIKWIDLRQIDDIAHILGEISRLQAQAIWCEGPSCIVPNSVDRLKIKPADVLVIWTIPPGRYELHLVMNIVRPSAVILSSFDPGMDDPQAFLERLAGLAKYVITGKEGKVGLTQLAAATAQTTQTVQAGLAWLTSHGDISVAEHNKDELVLQNGNHILTPGLKDAEMQLRLFLTESASFRNYYKRIELDTLIELFSGAERK